MLKSIKSRIKNLRTGADNTVIITVHKGHAIDEDSSSLLVHFQRGGKHITISGQINMRTNWVHFFTDHDVEDVLKGWGVNVDDIGLQIEQKSIPLNH